MFVSPDERPCRHALARLALLVLLSASLSACLGADRFLDQFFEARCTWEKACQPSFEDRWASIGQCVAAEKEELDERNADCSYDRKEARQCLDAAESWFAECSADYEKYEKYIEQCEQVYDCPGDEGEETHEGGGDGDSEPSTGESSTN